MITQLKVSIQSDLKTALDILMVAVGILLGGLLALLGLWLWFVYQANPTQSLMAIIGGNLATLLPLSARGFLSYQAQLMGLPLAAQTKAFWYMARAGGIIAYLLLWVSVVYGLILSTKITTGLLPAPLAYGLHEFLSLSTVTFAGLHSLVLLGDSYINFNIFHLVIPFIAPYRPIWTGLGTIGLYLGLAMAGSFYVRKQIGQKTWRALHYLTFGVYILALTHGLMAGTDSKLGLMKFMYLVSGGSVLFLTYYRLLTLKVRQARPARK